jgi:hypothetical protein
VLQLLVCTIMILVTGAAFAVVDRLLAREDVPLTFVRGSEAGIDRVALHAPY